MKTLENKRILICGKGGSGKSSVVTLLGKSLSKAGYRVILLDADASNPGGLFRLLSDKKKAPKALIEFFGGRDKVTCPSDDPSPLTRVKDNLPISEVTIDLAEIPEKYYFRNEDITLFQIGKIKEACEGCDGPMSKVARDFIVKGNFVTLIDVEAGIEHFGRGVENNVDMVLVVVDPTYESFVIAEIVSKMSTYLGNKLVWAILNKVDSKEIKLIMQNSLKKREVKYLGSIDYDKEIQKAGLEGRMINQCKAEKKLEKIVKRLEKLTVKG
jgi:CO dehydrogenase maturation factor